MIPVYWRQISSPRCSGGMTFKLKVKYKWGRQKNVVFGIETSSISETASDTAKVTTDHKLQLIYELSIGTTLDDLK